MNSILLCTHFTFSFSIHLCIDLKVTPCCGICTSALIDMRIQMSLWYIDLNSLDMYPVVELLDHMEILFLVVWRVSITAVLIKIPTNSVLELPFLYIPSSAFAFFHLLDNSQPSRCDIISHEVLICISLLISDAEHLFHVLAGHFDILLKNVYSAHSLVLIILFYFAVEFFEFLGNYEN
jgi:hypothetical protein